MSRAIAIASICVGIAAVFGQSDDSKIVGGWSVDNVDAIPFIVSVQVKHIGHNCGGSLFSPFYVLSACHCLADVSENSTGELLAMYDPEQFLFVAGATDFNKDMGYIQIREASAFYVHPKCSKDMALMYDVSVGEMKTRFQINEHVRPFNLLSKDPDKYEEMFSNLVSKRDTVCQVAGWGDTRRHSEHDPLPSPKLKAVRMYLIPEKDCQEMYGARDKAFFQFPFRRYSQICAVSRAKNESDCLGDSGSPFYCGEFVVGVVSYGYECGTSMPSVYTGLKEFLAWFMSEVDPLRPDSHLSELMGRTPPKVTDEPPIIVMKSGAHQIGLVIDFARRHHTIPRSALQALCAFHIMTLS